VLPPQQPIVKKKEMFRKYGINNNAWMNKWTNVHCMMLVATKCFETISGRRMMEKDRESNRNQNIYIYIWRKLQQIYHCCFFLALSLKASALFTTMTIFRNRNIQLIYQKERERQQHSRKIISIIWWPLPMPIIPEQGDNKSLEVLTKWTRWMRRWCQSSCVKRNYANVERRESLYIRQQK
jgi:hypothetical protein